MMVVDDTNISGFFVQGVFLFFRGVWRHEKVLPVIRSMICAHDKSINAHGRSTKYNPTSEVMYTPAHLAHLLLEWPGATAPDEPQQQSPPRCPAVVPPLLSSGHFDRRRRGG
jgi:hypothetical protein